MAINMQHNKFSFLDSSQLVTAREQANERKEQLQLAIDQLKEGMAKQLELLESQIKDANEDLKYLNNKIGNENTS